MSIGRDEDDKAFGEMMSGRAWTPKSDGDLQLTMEQMAEVNPLLALRFAFEVGMERGQEKRGCCEKRDG